MSKIPKILTKPEFPQLPGQYPETFCYIEHCTVLYCAEYQYPSEYKDFFKLGHILTTELIIALCLGWTQAMSGGS